MKKRWGFVGEKIEGRNEVRFVSLRRGGGIGEVRFMNVLWKEKEETFVKEVVQEEQEEEEEEEEEVHE
ncbi:hypothetical protein E2C01_054009 [Portunus trituberculatus]|uniref:Uncharacterized protein n=1 Tax=Portunus trituberculatus TaxID=210409 RepID=A0A5B7GQU3_PORTR|nr:hypothetical protein [Portunus trituberculatus]